MRLPCLVLALTTAALCGPSLHAAPPDSALETATVLVARVKVPAGAVLDEPEKLFKKVRYVKGDEPRAALTSFDQLKGKTVLHALAEDQPVKEEDVGDAAPSAPRPIQKGMRAVALRIDPTDKANSFLLPGCHVDVIVTLRTGEGQTTSQVLLQDVLVLAVDSRRRDDVATAAVTLALSPEDVERLILANTLNAIHLAPRVPDKDK